MLLFSHGEEFGQGLTGQFCSIQHCQGGYRPCFQFSLNCCGLFQESFSCLPAFLAGVSARLRPAESPFLFKMSQSFSKCSLQEGSYPLYIKAQSWKGRKRKMPIPLKTRPIMVIVSFSLYSNNESPLQGEGTEIPPLSGKSINEFAASFNLPQM